MIEKLPAASSTSAPLLPPLIVEKPQIDRVVTVLRQLLA